MKVILILLILLTSCNKSVNQQTEFLEEILIKDSNRTCEIIVNENYKSSCEWIDESPEDYKDVELMTKRKEIYDSYYASVFEIIRNQEYIELTEKPKLENEIFIFMSYTNEKNDNKYIYFYRDGYLKIAINREQYYYYSYDVGLINSITEIFINYYNELSKYPIY